MAENPNIEAKLSAYVEGELDAADRVEVERYLESNAQYRALLADLQRTRDTLRDLPRESAPAEIYEALQGQLERSALLGVDDSERRNTSRWPQFMVAAAVLLLTAALAALIYRVLPSSKTPAQVAILRAPPGPEETGPPVPQAPTMESAPKPGAINERDDTGEKQPAATEPAAFAMTRARNMNGANAPEAAPLDRTPAETDGAASPPPATAQLAQAAPQDYLVVHDSDPNAASDRIGRYLLQNKIAWQTLPSVPGAAADQAAAPSDAVAGAAPTTNTYSTTAQAQQTFVMGGNSQQQSVANSAPAGARMIFARRVSAQQLADLKTNLGLQAAGGVSSLYRPEPAATTSPTTAPSEATDLGATDWRNALESPTTQPSESATQPSAAPATASSITMGSAGRALNEIPATGPSAVLNPGDVLHLTAKDRGLDGVEAMNDNITIDPDGDIDLPAVGKVKAAGLTTDALKRSITQAYSQSPTQADWTVTRLSAASPPPAPTTAAANSAATTAPALSDVVIVVCPPAAATQSTQPTTAP